ncbi:unnamed protein product [Cladocopium goreaui]|uniref:Uncharacterized protein n=1 Tax=Cladocopium goreaui TaxID=2562237 RepID=A0A9P1CTN8_9DINO|nr:unnamed protein product [Cladocopium goreaui]
MTLVVDHSGRVHDSRSKPSIKDIVCNKEASRLRRLLKRSKTAKSKRLTELKEAARKAGWNVKTGLGDAEGLSELSAASSMGPSSDLSVASLGSKDEKLVRVAKQLQALKVALETTNPMKPHENPLPKGDVGKADRSHVSVIPTPQQKPMSKLPAGEKVSDIVRLLKSKPTAADSNSGDPEQTSRDVWKTHESEQVLDSLDKVKGNSAQPFPLHAKYVPAILAAKAVDGNCEKDDDDGDVRDFCEVFSGKGEITRALRAANLKGCAIDIDDNPRAFDLTTPSGFAPLGLLNYLWLTLNEVLRCKPGSLLVLAPVCTSMSAMSRHTSGRSYLKPYGNTNYEFVELGNTLACRCILLILVAHWRGLRWLLEQPDGSFLQYLPRFQWLLQVIKVYVAYFYMGKFNGETPKRHRVWSNDHMFLSEIVNRAGYMSRQEQQACHVKTARKYIDKKGVSRCVGIKDVLKKSQ